MTAVLAALTLMISPGRKVTLPQNSDSLASYLSEHPWDIASRGPLLVVDPAGVTRTAPEGGLRAFGRKEFSSGTLTAIAPTEMVMIDAAFKDPPNFYDGLPRTSKIYYLMSLLDSDQWKTACLTGIGLGDLRQDQRAVYRSILPSVFMYESDLVGKGNAVSPNPNEHSPVTLSAEEESGVRLHFYQDVNLGVKLQNGGFSAVGPQLADRKLEGKPYLRRLDVASEDRSSLFGVQIRKVVENRLKPSDLDYQSKRLDSITILPGVATIGEICKIVGESSGLKLIADVRVSQLTVKTFGTSARAGDVLRGLALSIAGTFRRVDDCFVLTCDLEGIGSKRFKIETWKRELEYQDSQRINEWEKIIRSKGGSRNIAIRVDNGLPINDPMSKFLDDDHEIDGTKTMPANQLPPEWQPIFKEGATHFSNSPMRTDVVFPYGEVLWNFILPDGRSLEWEDSLGYYQSLTREPKPDIDYTSRTAVRPIPMRAGSAAAAIFKTDDPSVASKLPALASAHGFEEVWLCTWQTNCLEAAIQSAKSLRIRLRLVLRPWEIPAGAKTADPDRTILGYTASQAESVLEGTARWRESSPVWGVPPVDMGTLMAPNEKLRSQFWQKLINLSKTTGLEGVVVCDTEPHGYEPKSAVYEFGSSTRLADFGYSQSLRARFLEENRVDPVDIVDKRPYYDDQLDLSLPFFGDPSKAIVDQPSGSSDKWNRFRANTNKQAILELMGHLPGELLFQPRHDYQGAFPLGGTQVIPWSDRTAVPTSAYQQNMEEEADNVPIDGYCIWQFGYPVESALKSAMYDSLNRHLRHAKGMLAIDLSSVPVTEIPSVLDRWFVKGH